MRSGLLFLSLKNSFDEPIMEAGVSLPSLSNHKDTKGRVSLIEALGPKGDWSSIPL